jgi:hypothetical protein
MFPCGGISLKKNRKQKLLCLLTHIFITSAFTALAHIFICSREQQYSLWGEIIH